MTTPPTARAGVALALSALVLSAAAAGYLTLGQSAGLTTAAPPAGNPATVATEAATGDLYGRVTTYDGTAYEGPLRWGGGGEAFWGHTFNGVKDENPWAAYAPSGPPGERARPTRVFGVEVPWGERPASLSRPFMVRFGDIARIEAHGDGVRGVLQDGAAFDPDVRVTLKSGTAFDLDRLSSSDFDDGVRVWDGRRGAVDLGPREIRSIELFPADPPADASGRLYGTVRTREGDFTGFLQWDREESLGRDRLAGRTAEGELSLRFDAVRSIVRTPSGGSRVTTLDGGEVVLSGSQKVGPGNRGVYVDDPRYGRVLVSWEALVRVDFRPVSGRSHSGPAYADYPPGRPLAGTVTTNGRRIAGRLVYDLDESETTETLDAPSQGVNYTIPFSLVASVVLPGRSRDAGRVKATATVTLWSGEELELERAGDLGDGHAGMLVFAGGQARPEHVEWTDVERVDFRRPLPTSAGLGRRDRD